MKTLIISLALVIFACSSPSWGATHCTAKEKAIFSCNFGKKMVSYCTSSNEESEKYIEYRFGRKYKLEMTFRSTSKSPTSIFYQADMLGASSSSTVLWFKNNDTHYVLNQPTKGEPFIEVVKNEKVLATLYCTGGYEGSDFDNNKLIQTKSQEDFLKLYGLDRGTLDEIQENQK